MENVRLVIFDLDGTIFRTETVDIKAVNRALALNGFKERDSGEILNLIGLTMDEVCQLLLEELYVSKKDKFIADVIRFEKEEINHSGELYPGVENYLSELGEEGYTLCICSNGGKEYVFSILNKFGISGLFDYVWYCRNGFSKSRAVGELKKMFKAGSFIMVGDRLNDIEAANDNKGISIGAVYGFGKEEAFHADYTAETFEQVKNQIIQIFKNVKES